MKRVKVLIPDLFLVLATTLCLWLFVLRHGALASSVDYLSQHSVFPDYFRQLFYETGQLIPQFAPNLGGGQNIFHFVYYGLLNPLVLPSYLLPAVPMYQYLQVVMALCLLASVLLMYHWLRGKGYDAPISIAAAMMLLLAGPMIFHSYRHIMFVDYMPFLLLGLMGVDRYWERHKSGLVTVSIFLMCMTSFYFSVGGLLVLGLYGTICAHRNWKLGYLQFLLDLLIGVLLAGCLLLPAALALGGRSGQNTLPSLTSLLIPSLDPTELCYNTYAPGLTTLSISVLLLGLSYRERRDKLLALGLLILIGLPVFRWLLGGMLYIREKSLIPLLPLLCERWADLLRRLRQKELSPAGILAAFGAASILCLGYGIVHRQSGNIALYLLLLGESVLLLAGTLIGRKHLLAAMLPPLCVLFGFGLYANGTAGEIIPAEDYAAYSSNTLAAQITETLSADPGWYRLEESGSYDRRKANINRIQSTRQWITSLYSSASDSGYGSFCRDVFQIEQPFRNSLMHGASKNPLFRKLMGVKYTVDPDTGAIEIQAGTAPIGYGTTRLLSRADFNRLVFPYRQLALMKYAVSGTASTTDPNWLENIQSLAHPIDIALPVSSALRREGSDWRFLSENSQKAMLTIPGSSGSAGQLLFLQFQVENQLDRDLTITVGGTKNKLTARSHLYYNGNTAFTYVVSLEPGQTEVPVTFGAGSYRIRSLTAYLGSSDILTDTSLYESQFQPDFSETKSNVIEGTISVSDTETFVTSIPYDSGFTAEVDGNAVPTQIVNTTFLGFSLAPGSHEIRIVYHAPGYLAGLLLSALGLALWLGLMIMERSLRKHTA